MRELFGHRLVVLAQLSMCGFEYMRDLLAGEPES